MGADNQVIVWTRRPLTEVQIGLLKDLLNVMARGLHAPSAEPMVSDDARREGERREGHERDQAL